MMQMMMILKDLFNSGEYLVARCCE